MSDVVITCTSSSSPFLEADHVRPGTCIAAVGADNEQKAEIGSSLLAIARIVTDQTAQCVNAGDLRRLDRRSSEMQLPEISAAIAGSVPRVQDDEIVLFDSTGLAVEDLAVVGSLLELSGRRGGLG
jgi:ornithine cyclodeaminase/alanine dehydrogenase